MRIYFSKNHTKLNGLPFYPERINPHICLNPKHPPGEVDASTGAKVLMDSAAFQDLEERVTFDAALQRQLDLEAKVGIISERIVAYDKLGDATETVKANQFLTDRRRDLQPRQIVLMLQGRNLRDYYHCARRTLRWARPGDCIGIGGCAMAGRFPKVRALLITVVKHVLPMLIARGFTDFHFFGVGTLPILKEVREIVLEMVGRYGVAVNLSADTSSYEVNAVMGKIIDPYTLKWRQPWDKCEKAVKERANLHRPASGYNPCELALANFHIVMDVVREHLQIEYRFEQTKLAI